MNIRITTLLLLVACMIVSANADTITVNTNVYFSSQLAGTTYYASNYSIFSYYGPTTTDSATNYVTGAVSPTTHPTGPVQVFFDFTGTNLEVVAEAWAGTMEDGQTETSITNYPNTATASVKTYVQFSFGSNTLHHLHLNLDGAFYAVKTFGTVTARTMPKQNLVIVLGDSYTQGYHEYHGSGLYWFDGWVWQLARLVPNTVCIPLGIGGTGFVHNSATGGTNYQYRVIPDVCGLYTNLVNSGKYDQIFITASGTVNDSVENTNALFTAATNVYAEIINRCPGAHVFFVGNWRVAQGQDAATMLETNEDSRFQYASSLLGIPYYSPIQAQVLSGGFGTGNYDLFFPAAEGSDNVHPGRYGYGVMANFVSTNMAATYGGTWTNGGMNPAVSGATYYLLLRQ